MGGVKRASTLEKAFLPFHKSDRPLCAAMEPSLHICACVLGFTHAEQQFVGLPFALGLRPSHILHPTHVLAECSMPHSCALHSGRFR